MKKIMISQPLAGKTDEQIHTTRNKFLDYAEEHGYEVINTLFTDEWHSRENLKERGVVQIPLAFMAKSVEHMALCDIVYFANGWEDARGCKIEHTIATSYGLETVYEETYRQPSNTKNY